MERRQPARFTKIQLAQPIAATRPSRLHGFLHVALTRLPRRRAPFGRPAAPVPGGRLATARGSDRRSSGLPPRLKPLRPPAS